MNKSNYIESDSDQNQQLVSLTKGNKHQDDSRLDQEPAEKKMKPNDISEFDSLLNELAEHLKLARHPDSLTALRSARILIENTLKRQQDSDITRESSRLAGVTTVREKEEIRVRHSEFRLDDVSLPKLLSSTKRGLSNRDETKESVDEEAMSKDEPTEKSAFERAARALILLYLDDQKQLQNQVNETISKIQSITANPKTDPRLIKTGR